jgi:alpha-D-ribose 1-methylphosphonate 5-triphosphate synthase subunit PhnI
MRILAAEPYEKPRDETVVEYTRRCLDGSLFRDGRLESTQKEVRNCSEAIGRLLDWMANEGLLTAPEITGIVEGLPNHEATFVES